MPRLRKGKTTPEVAERQSRIAKLALQGYRNVEIAHMLGLPENTGQAIVSKDMKQIVQAWKDSAIRDFDALKSEEIAQIKLLRKELWQAWKASKKDSCNITINVQKARRKVTESEQANEDENLSPESEVGSSQGQSPLEIVSKNISRQRQKREGNQAYAKLILETIKEMCEIQGIITKPGELTTAPPVTGFKIIMPPTNVVGLGSIKNEGDVKSA